MGGKKAKDPNAPKRPMGAYFLFMNDHRDATKAENPGMKIGEIAKILGQKWANLEKEEQAKEAKAKYEEAKKKYDAGEPAEEEEEEDARSKKRKANANLPKKAKKGNKAKQVESDEEEEEEEPKAGGSKSEKMKSNGLISDSDED